MRLDWLHRRARQIVSDLLSGEDEAEVHRILIGDALIEREGEHYRIASGGESWEELEERARRLEGTCDCGNLLSTRAGTLHCRSCGRRYPGE